MTTQMAVSAPDIETSDRTGWAAAAWAAAYGTVALVWTVTGSGFPYGRGDPNGNTSLLHGLPADVGAPVFAAVLLTAAVAALAMSGRHAVRMRGVPRALLLGYAYAVAAALLIVVPGMSLLALAGYAPMLLIGAPFGWPPVPYSEIFTWSIGNKAFAVLGGLLLARAALHWQRRTAGACARCGRAAAGGGPTTPAAAARWGRWPTYVAVAIPPMYAVTRFAWLLGIPLGISEEMLRDLRDSGGVWAGAGLGAFAVVGAVLTIGLVRPWGEVFPRWIPGLAGRRVPVALAVVPATVVAVLVTAGSLGMFSSVTLRELLGDFNLAVLPAALWPVWGVALAMAAYAYYLRRRGRCTTCGLAD